MAIVKLKPRNKRGKQLIKEHGPVWDLLHESDYTIALGGPGYFIRSIVDGKESRWIKRCGGPHFKIIEKRGSI